MDQHDLLRQIAVDVAVVRAQVDSLETLVKQHAVESRRTREDAERRLKRLEGSRNYLAGAIAVIFFFLTNLPEAIAGLIKR